MRNVSLWLHRKLWPKHPMMSLCARAHLYHHISWFWSAWRIVFGKHHCKRAYEYWRDNR